MDYESIKLFIKQQLSTHHHVCCLRKAMSTIQSIIGL
jgi:hypothetical protein